ncbi:YpiF family protein [Fictibacillus sp. Mic-4]|uniref:YpiF family protein n=1 Tax=Fictibacillus TaxID=1329200 RepID=UPI00040EC8B0|nr:YpiF family protein [Fictibacillus gelatini]
MKWESRDFEVYDQSKEYVDTALVPLLPVSFNDKMKNAVGMGEYVDLLSKEIERQLHGRVLLLPPFTYLKSKESEVSVELLGEWSTALEDEAAFKHIFFLTSDVDWKKIEHTMKQTLLWLPAIPLESMDESYKEEMIREQVKQLMTVIFNEWQKRSV